MDEKKNFIRKSIFCFICKHCRGGIFDLSSGRAVDVSCEF